MCFLILVPSRDWNHIFHNYDTKVEKDTLINEDDAHKVFFCTFSDLLKIFYMWPNHMNLQDGKHVDVKMLFSSKWSYLAVFSWSLDTSMFRICKFLHYFFRFKISLTLFTRAWETLWTVQINIFSKESCLSLCSVVLNSNLHR